MFRKFQIQHSLESRLAKCLDELETSYIIYGWKETEKYTILPQEKSNFDMVKICSCISGISFFYHIVKFVHFHAYIA